MFNKYEEYKDCFISALVKCEDGVDDIYIYNKPGIDNKTRVFQKFVPITDFNNPTNNICMVEGKNNVTKGNRYFANAYSLFNKHNIIVVDCDLNIKDNDPKFKSLFNILLKVQGQSLMHIVSKSNHITFVLRVKEEDKNIFMNKDISVDNGKGYHIEFLNLHKNKMVYGINETTLTKGKDEYYTLTKDNEFDYIADTNVLSEFNEFLNSYINKSKKKNSIKTNSSIVDDGDLIFYKNWIDEYNNPPFSAESPYQALMSLCGFVKGGFLGQKEFDELVLYIEEKHNKNIRNSKFFNEPNAYNKLVKDTVKTNTYTKYQGFMSVETNGSFKRFVIEKDFANGGYKYYRPKNSSDATSLFGEILFVNKIIEVYNNNRLDEIIYKEHGETYFNHSANTVAKLEIRNKWLENNNIYDDVELNVNTYKVFKNILGNNLNLFLKKEAIVTATLNKLKFIDIIGSRERNVGKSSIVRLLTKTRLPMNKWLEVDKFIAGRPETNGDIVKFGGSIEDYSVSLHFDEFGYNRGEFEFSKAVQSPMGVNVPKKGKDAYNINPPYISTYYTFNVTNDLSNIYFNKRDTSFYTSVCLTVNEDSKDIKDNMLDIDLSYMNTNDCVINLTQYLLKLYTSMTEDEVKDICKNYASYSKYNLDDYLEDCSRSKTDDLKNEYISVLNKGNISNINDFINSEELYSYMSRSRIDDDVKSKIKDHINKNEYKLTYGVHKAICCVLNINTRKTDLTKFFSGRSDRSIYVMPVVDGTDF